MSTFRFRPIPSLLLSACGLACTFTVAAQDLQVLPPRSSAADYLSQGSAGKVSVGAEFKGHIIPTPEGNLSSEDYVTVEVALYGPSGATLKLSAADFSLKINGKSPLPAQPYGLLTKSLRDPELEPLSKDKDKPKSSIGTGGQQNAGDPPPLPAKIPVETQRAWTQRVQKASLPEGDRPLPVAGFLYFQHRGKSESVKSLELLYNGPAGKTSIALEP